MQDYKHTSLIDRFPFPNERIVDIVAANRNIVLPVKQALVVSTKLSFGLSRMYELLATENDPQTTQVFYSYDEAMDWLCSS